MSQSRIKKQLSTDEIKNIKYDCRHDVFANGGSDIFAFAGTFAVGSLPLAPLMPVVPAVGWLGFGCVAGLAGVEYRHCVNRKIHRRLADTNEEPEQEKQEMAKLRM